MRIVADAAASAASGLVQTGMSPGPFWIRPQSPTMMPEAPNSHGIITLWARGQIGPVTAEITGQNCLILNSGTMSAARQVARLQHRSVPSQCLLTRLIEPLTS